MVYSVQNETQYANSNLNIHIVSSNNRLRYFKKFKQPFA